MLGELELASAKRCGTDFGLCYNPEFVALGSVIRDLRNPDFGKLAEAFGVPAWRCEGEAELERAVRAALATRRPGLVEVMLRDQ